MRVFLIILGILMLLPGACGAFFTVYGLLNPESISLLISAVPELAVGIGGIVLIIYAIRQKP
jgi:hypothetical protein